MKTTFRTLTVAWPLVIFLLLPALTRAETAVQAWVQRYNGPGNGDDYATAVAVDGSNNVIVTGYSYGAETSYDYATIKYSSAGVPLWTNRYNGPGNGDDDALAVAVDGSNNVIVTGYSYWQRQRNYDYATIKYSSAGVPLWTNRYNGPGNGDDWANAVAVDGSNNVIVTGYSTGSGSDYNYATIKYSSAGVPLWTNRYDGPGTLLRARRGGGRQQQRDRDRAVLRRKLCDYATIKYSSAGVPLWTNRYNGPGTPDNDYACAVAVDGSNNVIVTGSSYGSEDSYDYATIKYSSAGVPLWTNRYNGPANGQSEATAMAVDGSNNVIVTGYSAGSAAATITRRSSIRARACRSGPTATTGRGTADDLAYAVAVDGSNNVIVTGYSTGSGSDSDYATIKYSSAGVPLWTNRYNGPGSGNDQANAVAVDRSGNVIVTGYSTGSGRRL